jgi:hypothetical protein
MPRTMKQVQLIADVVLTVPSTAVAARRIASHLLEIADELETEDHDHKERDTPYVGEMRLFTVNPGRISTEEYSSPKPTEGESHE